MIIHTPLGSGGIALKKSEERAVVKKTLRTLLGFDWEEPDRVVFETIIKEGRCPSEFGLEGRGICSEHAACFKCWCQALHSKNDTSSDWC